MAFSKCTCACSLDELHLSCSELWITTNSYKGLKKWFQTQQWQNRCVVPQQYVDHWTPWLHIPTLLTDVTAVVCGLTKFKIFPTSCVGAADRLEKHRWENLDLKITRQKFSHPFFLHLARGKRCRAWIWKRDCLLYPTVMHVHNFQLSMMQFWRLLLMCVV